MVDVPSGKNLQLNWRAHQMVEKMALEGEKLRITAEKAEGGGRILDAGVKAAGGLEAGLEMARVCLSSLGEVSLIDGDIPHPACPRIQVATDHPIAACLASQYAGWRISVGKFFAMGSGPMRAAYGGEDLFHQIGYREAAEVAVGVLESSALPGPDVFRFLSEKTRVEPSRISLIVAPTKSLAGSIQVVARSVETALHKLHSIHFDLSRVEAALGSAPLPPPAKTDLAAIGRTNDAVLYGGRVTLWVRGDDQSVLDLGPCLPSSASPDHGVPFAAIFERYQRDFYKIDPGLFSPAEVTFQNLDTGNTHRFGRLDPAVLERSFFG